MIIIILVENLAMETKITNIFHYQVSPWEPFASVDGWGENWAPYTGGGGGGGGLGAVQQGRKLASHS